MGIETLRHFKSQLHSNKNEPPTSFRSERGMWLQLALLQLSCSLFSQVTLRALFIISKSGRSNPPLIFGPIIVVCLILGFVFHTNSEIAVLTDAANCKGKVSTDVLQTSLERARLLRMVIRPYKVRFLPRQRFRRFFMEFNFSSKFF